MPASLGAAYVVVKADRSKLKGGLDKAYRTTDSFAKQMQRRISRINFKGVGIAAAAAATGAVYALSKVISSTVSLANTQEAAEKRLEAVIRSTGEAAGFTTKEMIEMAGALQSVTTVGDETIIAGQAILATFKNIAGDAFKRTTAAALDLSEVMQQDLRSSVVMLGKAMNDPIANLGALGRAGVQFDKEQKELIKTLWAAGNQMEAQNIILTELESQFGGAAKAARDTYGGAVKAAKNAMYDLGEQIGFAITKNETFAGLVKELETYFISLKPKIEEVVLRFIAWTDTNKELIKSKIQDVISAIGTAINIAATAAGLLYDAVKLAWDLLIAPPLAAIEFVQDLGKEAETTKGKIEELNKELIEAPGEITTAWRDLLGFLTEWGDQVITVIGAALKIILKTLATMLNQTGRFLELVFRTYSNITSGHFKDVWRDIKTFTADTKNVFSQLGKDISSDWKTAIDDMMKRQENWDQDLEDRFENAKKQAEETNEDVRDETKRTNKYISDGAKIITEDMTNAYHNIAQENSWLMSDLKNEGDHYVDAVEMQNRLIEQSATDSFNAQKVGMDDLAVHWADALDNIDDKTKDTTDRMKREINAFSYNATSSLSTGFFTIATKGFDDLGDVGKGFLDSLLRQLTDFLASSVVADFLSFSKGTYSFGGGGGIIGGIVDVGKSLVGGLADLIWYQHGTANVPETGIYGLHKGEMVIPPEQSEMLRGAGFGSDRGYSSSTTGSGSNRSGDGLFGMISSSLANEAAFASGYPGTSKGAQYGGMAGSVMGSLVGGVFGPAGGFIASNLLGGVGALVGGFISDLIGPANELHDDAVMSIEDVTAQMEKLGIDTIDIVGKSAVELANEVAGLVNDFGDQFNTMAFAAEQYTKEMYENFRTKASDFGDFTEVSAEQKSKNLSDIVGAVAGLFGGSVETGGGAGREYESVGGRGGGGTSETGAEGPSGQQGGSGSGSVEHFGNWRIPKTGRYELMKGEMVIPRDAAENMRNSNAMSGGSNQANGRPMQIILQIGRSEWAADVNAIREVERVKLVRRPVGARRTAF